MATLNEFKSKFLKHEKKIGNQLIEFYTNQINSPKTLIFLPGTSGKAETYHKILLNFDDTFNIIALDYPMIMRIDDLIETIEKFIDSFSFKNVSLIGNSFGTLIIQMLLKKRPNDYDSIFLINPSTKTVQVKTEDIQSHIKSYKKQLHILNGIFPFLYKTSYKRNIKVMVYNSSIKDKKKWYKFYIDLFKQTKREQSIAIYECLLDFWQSKDFLKSDFKNFDNPVHILKSDINISQSKSEFDSVSDLFKNVKVYKLPDNRNLTLIKHSKLISNVIKDSFIKK
jgi:pimeloyl-ACP methyl ester carboxylesterase